MKRLFCFILSTICITLFYAQEYKGVFAVINDLDGYSNVRDTLKNVIDRVYKDEIIVINSFEYDELENYIPIIYGWGIPEVFTRYGWNEEGDKTIREKQGFIHHSRLKYISDLPRLSKSIIDRDIVEFKGDNESFKIRIGFFNKSEYKIDKNNFEFDATIDGFAIHGTDGNIEYPLYNGKIRRAREIKEISYSIDEKHYFFQKKHLCGYLEPNVDYMYIAKSDSNIYYLVMSNRDGAGAYEIIWTIKNGEIKSVITYRDF